MIGLRAAGVVLITFFSIMSLRDGWPPLSMIRAGY
jgi:hypothetical protein